jgi:hypothetical protein
VREDAMSLGVLRSEDRSHNFYERLCSSMELPPIVRELANGVFAVAFNPTVVLRFETRSLTQDF